MHFICFYNVFIAGILWLHWYGFHIGDSRRRWFSGCIGVDLGKRFWFGSPTWIWNYFDHWIRFLSIQSLKNSEDWPSRLSSVQKRQSGMSRHVAAAICFVFSSICFVFFKNNCLWEGVWVRWRFFMKWYYPLFSKIFLCSPHSSQFRTWCDISSFLLSL